MKLNGPIEIKGSKAGIKLIVKEIMTFDDFQNAMRTLLNEYQQFFKGASIIACENMTMSYRQKADIEDILTNEYGIPVVSLENPKEFTDIVVKERVVVEEKIVEKVIEKIVEKPCENETVFVNHTMRSGMRVESDGHIVVQGDVNPGAEVIAKGNIVVIGTLRGTAHAGVGGHDEAFIIALDMRPTQLRINDQISQPPSDVASSGVEKAVLKDGRIHTLPC